MSSRSSSSSAALSREVSNNWMLQAEAAAVAGCSVSVIRKWRRAGAIAERVRTSTGGMKRIEVRLNDVLEKMQDSMPERLTPVERIAAPVVTDPPEVRPAAPDPGLRPAELEAFVRHIAEAERRAAVAEAQLQANDVMVGLLRERVEALQSQLEAAAAQGGSSGTPGNRHLGGLVSQIREFRQGFEELERKGIRHDPQERLRARHTYDVALLSLCAAAGIRSRFKLGASLTPTDRNRLSRALADIGLDVMP